MSAALKRCAGTSMTSWNKRALPAVNAPPPYTSHRWIEHFRRFPMPSNTAENLMLSQALRLLAQVDDLRRLSFDIGTAAQWEPPLDLIETRTEIVAYVALPGVEAADVTVTAQDDML
ncbi:unnamed protein product, partial [Chrysoparadoxa australica]